MRSFKSNENIHKKEGGLYYVVSANKVATVSKNFKINLEGLFTAICLSCLSIPHPISLHPEIRTWVAADRTDQ